MSTFFSKTLIYASTFRCYWCSLDSSQALQGCVAYIGANTTYRLPIFEAKIRVQKQLQMQIPYANCPPTFWRKFKVQIPPNTSFVIQLR